MNLKHTMQAAMAFAAGALVLAGASASSAQATFYAASGSNGVAGSLYIINGSNGSIISTQGALLNAAGGAYGMTGMAFSSGGTLYGSTANASPTGAGHLVTINPTNGQVTDIGAFGITATMSDITFAGGTLYGWGSVGHNLYSISLATGAATLVGPSGVSGFGGGGIAMVGGVMYGSLDGANLYTISTVTGAATVVGPHSGPGWPGNALGAMDSTGGVLYALNSDRAGGTSNVQLSTVNTSTAAITNLGPTIGNGDALAILTPVPEPATFAVFGLGMAGVAFLRRRRNS